MDPNLVRLGLILLALVNVILPVLATYIIESNKAHIFDESETMLYFGGWG